jgi:ribosomal protein S18 acetylase RimI-like enzyme
MNGSPQGSTRQLKPEDLDRVVDIDRRITGRSRSAFFEKRLQAALADARNFIATAVESDGKLTGFAIARLQDGEFGDARRVATVDVVGVDPDSQHRGQGSLLLGQLTGVMRKLDVHELRTQVGWHDVALTRFFAASGFSLAPRQALERSTARMAWDQHASSASEDTGSDMDAEVGESRMDAGVPDYSDPEANDYAPLEHDKVLVRSLSADDLAAVIRIDRKLTGRDRTAFFEAKLREVLGETGIRVSLIAEVDDRPAGFVMARVDYGEYGRTEPAAVLDAIGVEPDSGHQGIGRALLSQLLMNLGILQVETLRTTVRWNNIGLLGFLDRAGFAPSQQLLLSKTVN